MAKKWRKNGDQNAEKMAIEWRKNGDKMAIKCNKMAKKWRSK